MPLPFHAIFGTTSPSMGDRIGHRGGVLARVFPGCGRAIALDFEQPQVGGGRGALQRKTLTQHREPRFGFFERLKVLLGLDLRHPSRC